MNANQIKFHLEQHKAKLAKLEELDGQWLYVETGDGEQLYADYVTDGPINYLKDFLISRLKEEITLCNKMLRNAEGQVNSKDAST